VRDLNELLSYLDNLLGDSSIKKLLELQGVQNNLWIKDYKILDDYEKNELLKEYLLGINFNSLKILKTVDWQKNILVKKELDFDELSYQLVDVLKYLLSILLLFDINIDYFVSCFSNKSLIVDRDFKQQLVTFENETRIISVDIDGVLADYHTGIVKYFIDKNIINETYREKYHDTYNYCEFFDMNIEEFERNKDLFIENNGLINLPVIEYARESINELIDKGFKIILLTARPKLVQIVKDTMIWLNKNNINYHKLFFEKDKDELFKKIYPAHISIHIDDRDKHAIEMNNVNVLVYLFDTDYNKHMNTDNFNNIIRVKNWFDILEKIKSTWR